MGQLIIGPSVLDHAKSTIESEQANMTCLHSVTKILLFKNRKKEAFSSTDLELPACSFNGQFQVLKIGRREKTSVYIFHTTPAFANLHNISPYSPSL